MILGLRAGAQANSTLNPENYEGRASLEQGLAHPGDPRPPMSERAAWSGGVYRGSDDQGQAATGRNAPTFRITVPAGTTISVPLAIACRASRATPPPLFEPAAQDSFSIRLDGDVRIG